MNSDEIRKIMEDTEKYRREYLNLFDYSASSDETVVIGYKILHVCRECEYQGRFGLVSPTYEVHWINGHLRAHCLPSEKTMDGIHFVKNPISMELVNYLHSNRYMYLVECALSGTVIETERGYRAQYAEILRMVPIEYNGSFGGHRGNWQSYQEVEHTETKRIRQRVARYSKESYFDPFAF